MNDRDPRSAAAEAAARAEIARVTAAAEELAARVAALSPSHTRRLERVASGDATDPSAARLLRVINARRERIIADRDKSLAELRQRLDTFDRT